MAGNIIDLRKGRRYDIQRRAPIATAPKNALPSSDVPNQLSFTDGAPRMPVQTFGVVASTAPKQALQTNPNRGYLYIQNNSTDDIYVAFDQTPTPQTSLIIGAGGYYEPRVVPTNSVWVVSASLAHALVSIVEGSLTPAP